jgi:hypothetical protein
MAKVLEDTNQGTPSQGDSCAFPFFGNVGAPLMATLNIPGLNVGLPVWLWTTLNVPNALDASQISTLCHGHHMDVDPLPSASTKSTPSPSPSSGESLATSNQKSKRNRKRKSKKKKSPTSASHVGDLSPTSASHVGGKKPVLCKSCWKHKSSHCSHTGEKSPTSASHVGDVKTSAVMLETVTNLISCWSHMTKHQPLLVMLEIVNNLCSHVGDKQPTSASHVGGKSSHC